MFQPDLLKGKRILVTGGGSGLGKETARTYASLGASLYLWGRRAQLLEETAAELQAAYGVQVTPCPVNIRDPEAVDAAVERIWRDGGAIDGLLNNAAGNFVGRTEDMSHRGFDAIANTVMHGTFYVTHSVGRRWVEAARELIAAGESVPVRSVVSILVTWIFNGGPYVVPSAMSKSAIGTMIRSLAVEWGQYGIRRNGIAPGEFPTEGMTARLSAGELTAGRHELNPMGRVGRMPELCNLATFLMADGVDWLSGQVVTIDGANALATGGNFYAYRKLSDADWHGIREQDARDRAARA